MTSKDEEAKEELVELLGDVRYVSSRSGRQRGFAEHHRRALARFLVAERHRVLEILEEEREP